MTNSGTRLLPSWVESLLLFSCYSSSSTAMQPQIFISYCWKNKDIADSIDKDWETVGIKLIRDIRDLEFKQNIKAFMQRIDTCDYVLLLISKGYLCMYEALELFEEPSCKGKVLPILVEDARIVKPKKRAK
jgi:hypothetical protein